jgi:hypothetical protein
MWRRKCVEEMSMKTTDDVDLAMNCIGDVVAADMM